MTRLTEQAKRNVRDNLDHLERFFAERYRLPPTHESFLCESAAFWTQQMLQDYLHRRRALRNEVLAMRKMGAEGKQARLHLESIYSQINAINALVGEPPEHNDTGFAEYEAMLERGVVPGRFDGTRKRFGDEGQKAPKRLARR